MSVGCIFEAFCSLASLRAPSALHRSMGEGSAVGVGVSVVGDVMGTIRRGWNFRACDFSAWRFSGGALGDAAETGPLCWFSVFVCFSVCLSHAAKAASVIKTPKTRNFFIDMVRPILCWNIRIARRIRCFAKLVNMAVGKSIMLTTIGQIDKTKRPRQLTRAQWI